ncbi:MAG TPA: pitrilysin family protein [Candidatus Limnocylindrales bacterium]|nr:pitrilysin family protein [Candidatus Limnocylindrales bacterium]
MRHTVEEITLKNGAKGLFIHTPDATVMSLEINFRAGDFLTPPDKWETAHLMEHLLLGANKLIRKARSFQAEFEKNGAYCNASTGSYDITYEAECADFEWERIADLLLLAISKPLFLEDEFQAEFGNVREEMISRSNNHFRHLSLALRQAYGYKVLTDQERLKQMPNVKIDDIRRHYAKTHMTQNMRFVIAGKITEARQARLVELLEGMELPEGKARIEMPDETPVGLKESLYIANRTVENMHFYMDTFIGRRLNEKESDALGLVNTMLTETLHSRILGEAREKGLVYHMSSNYLQTKCASNWWFGAQITPANAEALFTIITKEIRSVCNGEVTAGDIASAQQYLLGRFQRSGQTVAGTAAGYSGRYFFDDYIDDYYQIPDRIGAITKDQIVDVTNEFFDKSQWGVGFLGSATKDLREQLTGILATLWQK